MKNAEEAKDHFLFKPNQKSKIGDDDRFTLN
jgi:hypothetical protein